MLRERGVSAAYTGVGSAVGNCPWVCNAAHFLNSSACSACPANSWCSANVLNACPNNAVSNALSYAQNQCLCAPGYAGNGSVTGTSPCHICNAGFYCPGGNSNLSLTCGQNFSSPVGSSAYSSCQCVPGYLRTGTYSCQLCAPGQICISGALSTCPANSNAPQGSSSASACVCNPGFYGPNGGPCVQCPNNSFCPGGNVITGCTANAISPLQSINSSACYCDRGYQGVGNAACVACPSNTWCWTEIQNVCPANTSSPALSSYPTNCTCLAGFTGADGSACSPCAPGTYKPVGGSASCGTCPINDYCWQGSINPTVCPVGNSSSPSGSMAVGQCQCNAGFYGSQCSLCRVAYFCPGGNPTYACPNNGYTTAGASSASQCMCPANSALNASLICECIAGYQHIVDMTAPSGWRCGVCPANAYCTGNGVANACPATSTSPAQSVNFSACLCAAPQYMTLSCGNCLPNQYYISNTKCGACPASSTSPSGTANVSGCICNNGTFSNGPLCSACPPGLFCEFGGSAPCPFNAYCPGGTVNPIACPALSTAPMYSNSSSACECGEGYYMSGGVCLLCGYGTYSSSGAVGACTACPANSNTSSKGQALLSQCLCVPGYTGDARSKCVSCPFNSYCPGNRANYTMPCPNATYSNAGASSSSQCYCPSNSSWLPGLNCTCYNGSYSAPTNPLQTVCGNGAQCSYAMTTGLDSPQYPLSAVFTTTPCSGAVTAQDEHGMGVASMLREGA